MARPTRLSRTGRITIPKAVREALGWQPFDTIEWVLKGHEVTLRKVPRTLAEIAGTLPPLGIVVEDMTSVAKEERIRRLTTD